MHRLWKDRLVEKLRPRPGQRHLDVAGGTGDVAFRVLAAMRAAQYGGGSSFASSSGGVGATPGAPAAAGAAGEGAGAAAAAAGAAQQEEQGQQQQDLPSITVCDINAAMLAEGRKKAEAGGIGPESMQWVEGNAEALPFPSASFDSYTIAFGIRNVTDRPAALREAHRFALIWFAGWLAVRGHRGAGRRRPQRASRCCI